MTIKLLLTSCLIFQFIFGYSQEKPKSRAEIIKTSKEQIKQLSQGVLLVRLSTKKNSIDAMRKVGKLELAKKTIQKNDKRNQIIIKAFRKNFSFCPTYFFYSDDSELIADRNLNEVSFLNDSLKVDSTIKITSNIYFIAEFGITEPDKTIYSVEEYYENGRKKEKYHSGSGITLTALIIKDYKFEQLKEPFPYYVRERKGMPFKRSIWDVVLKMNFELKTYLEKVTN